MAGEDCSDGSCGDCGRCDRDEARCEFCGSTACQGDCPEYYEALEDEQDEWNADDEEINGDLHHEA